MILIADGGSTKTSWCLVNSNGERSFFKTEGYNPFFVSKEYVVQSLKKWLPSNLPYQKIKALHFYGSGVHAEAQADILLKALSTVFIEIDVTVYHDMLAASRALLGNEKGFAAILGTGTNTCIYDGVQITQQIDSLGYILGDEGSGSAIGRRLLSAYLRNKLPSDLHQQFEASYKLRESDIIEQVYTKPLANRFIASFCAFVGQNIQQDFMYDLVAKSFESLFKEIVIHYPNYQSYTFNCVGSVGYHFKDILIAKAACFGMSCGKIISNPIDGLVDYHQLQILNSKS
jgi:glucosamine kinase